MMTFKRFHLTFSKCTQIPLLITNLHCVVMVHTVDTEDFHLYQVILYRMQGIFNIRKGQGFDGS